MSKLRWTTRVINEAMRLYPQPPVLIRRAAVETTLVRSRSFFPVKSLRDRPGERSFETSLALFLFARFFALFLCFVVFASF